MAAFAQAHMVRPEQSNASGPSAPHRYGLPTCANAARIAVDAAVRVGDVVDGTDDEVGVVFVGGVGVGVAVALHGGRDPCKR